MQFDVEGELHLLSRLNKEEENERTLKVNEAYTRLRLDRNSVYFHFN